MSSQRCIYLVPLNITVQWCRKRWCTECWCTECWCTHENSELETNTLFKYVSFQLIVDKIIRARTLLYPKINLDKSYM